MPFGPTSKIQIALKQATPTAFTTDVLRTQLSNVGMGCSQLTDSFLQGSIDQVNSQLVNGSVQTFGIKRPATPATGTRSSVAAVAAAASGSKAAATGSTAAATGNWEPGTQAEGFNAILDIIAYQEHFMWLYNNKSTTGFQGVVDNPPEITGDYPNAQSIQDLFVQICTTAASTLINGLDLSSMQAILTNVIAPLANANLQDYNVTDSRTIMLVENYNQQTGQCDALGVLWISWTLTITDYQRKSKDGGDTHPTALIVNSGSVTYTDPSQICTDYQNVCRQFGITPQSCPPQ